MNGVFRVGSPGKGTVTVHQNSGYIVGSFACEGFNNDFACIKLIFVRDFLIGHLARAGYFSKKIVAVGCSQGLYAAARLRINRRPAAVGMDDSADIYKASIQLEMSRGIR